MMELEERIYDMPVEVKQVVISVQDYHVRREISPVPWGLYDEPKIDVELAKQGARHDLLDGLEQFVKVDIDRERNFVEAQIWMPYVKDDLVKSLEETERRQMTEITCLQGENAYMAKRIKYLELPWWEKLHLWIKGRVK